MRDIKIYTAGKMAGLSFVDQMQWRWDIANKIANRVDSSSVDYGVNIRFIHPPNYYRYGEDTYKTVDEIKRWDLSQVRTSDIVIVNLDGVNESIGTHFELGCIDTMNTCGGKYIYVIGIGESKDELYPWINESMHRIEKDYDAAAEYIVDYLLV